MMDVVVSILSPIAIGAMIRAEILTPKSVFLIWNICSIKVSIRLSILYRLDEEEVEEGKG